MENASSCCHSGTPKGDETGTTHRNKNRPSPPYKLKRQEINREDGVKSHGQVRAQADLSQQPWQLTILGTGQGSVIPVSL